MAAIHRRTFIERLGLGAGAALLGPTIKSAVSQAQGQVVRRKRLFLMVQGNGMDYTMFAPPGLKPGDLDAKIGKDKLFIAEGVTAQAQMFTPLAPYKDRLLYVDGLSSFVGEKDHSLTYCALSGVPGDGSSVGPPGGQTFDQWVAGTSLGKNMVFPSILLGVTGMGPTGYSDRPLMTTVFATGRDKPAPHMAFATTAYKQTFGSLAAPTAPTGPAPYNARKKLLDFLRDDAGRARTALAGTEKAKLDQLLGSIDALDLRMAELSKLSATARANAKLAPITTEPATLEQRADAHMQIAATALLANLTNVIGYSAAAGNAYPVWSGLGLMKNAHEHGHGETEGKPIHPLDMVHMFFGDLLVKAMRMLEAVPEGDGTMLDNTIIVWLSDQAEAHHPFLWRWPALVIANPKTSGLRTGGRFVRYPLARKPGVTDPLRKFPTADIVASAKAPGGRCLADLYCTVAHALGVPTDTFGSGGTEVVRGALPELM
jgi:hypothetical protein